jgi:hypothetical protein
MSKWSEITVLVMPSFQELPTIALLSTKWKDVARGVATSGIAARLLKI